GRGGRSVAGIVAGLRGDLAHHLRAHVLELVFEFDLLGDGDAVLGDARRAIGLVEHDIAALGTQRRLDGVVEDIDAAQHAVAGVGGEAYVFGGHQRSIPGLRREERRFQAAFFFVALASSITPMTSDSFMVNRSSPSILTSVPDHLPNSTRSPALTSSGTSLPPSSRAPGPTAMTSPSCGFSLAVSGIMIPPFVFSSPSMRRMTTRRTCFVSACNESGDGASADPNGRLHFTNRRPVSAGASGVMLPGQRLIGQSPNHHHAPECSALSFPVAPFPRAARRTLPCSGRTCGRAR